MSKAVSKQTRNCLLVLFLSSIGYASWGQSFTATVKLTLVNPITLTEEKGVDFGLIHLVDGGQCNMAPATGMLSGDACGTSAADKSVINISGSKGLAVSVSLSESNTVSGVQFIPRLFNGTDDNLNFVLSDFTHSINIGGSLLISDAATAGPASLSYGVEVMYQ